MTLSHLVIAFAVILVAALAWQNAGFRDRALGCARQHCERMQVQLLDETIALVRISIGRDQRGNFGLRRQYEFEFTVTGENRYRGQLRLFSRRIESIELQPHQV
ncbi:DUF3301 domain-containing protein [Pseudomaricurvus alcaniphilus]|uniref:DUF3301 domain-containing protein n=1 Tax=Pseudomaricurvus alcaniphilus TaxID=1166482 RepID=UPI00140CF523|nr:DUF3301 domain-containing protein [Pseudomaricurvus alcaniphilus]NHN39096.1 DUF3301 domain-containing protein [Pseudomaricurvus alcaniphilus]